VETEELGSIANDGVKLGKRHRRLGERIVQEIGMPFLVIHEIQGEPGVRGSNAPQVLGEGDGRLRAIGKLESDAVEEEAAWEHDPRPPPPRENRAPDTKP
jgi:hypothetical protein